MNIFFYCTFSNNKEWYYAIKKKFKHDKIFTNKDVIDYQKIDVAIVWNLPNDILKELTSLKVLFSLGAGVDHITKLSNYKQIPIIRIKDPNMRSRMFNHVLSQILNYQLKLHLYQAAKGKNIWLDGVETLLNYQIKIGILGVGYIGNFVAKNLKKLNYQVIGFKNSAQIDNNTFSIFSGKKLDQFIKDCNIIVSILPSTDKTNNFIDKNFLKKMKKKSLLINIGRGASLKEEDLIDHLKLNKDFYVSLDVFKNEPLNTNHKFWKNRNITITPHVAAITDLESTIDCMFKRFVKYKKTGKIKSDVDIKKGY